VPLPSGFVGGGGVGAYLCVYYDAVLSFQISRTRKSLVS